MLYMVTSGNYSVTSIVAIFSDEVLATRLAEYFGEVIPIELDVEAPYLRAGLIPYFVRLNPHGTVDAYPQGLPDAGTETTLGLDEYYVWATSKDDAIQMAQTRQKAS